MIILRDNPDYVLCRACGGTGWAYAARVNSDGTLIPEFVSPTMVRFASYVPCPDCQYGSLRKMNSFA